MRLADFILANAEAILAEWEAFARTIWPGAATTDPATLRDDAADMLRATAADMKSDQTAAQQADKSKGKGGSGTESAHVDRASAAHGAGRVASGFDLAALIAEYRALRASVIRLWRESRPNPDLHDLDDLTRFNESIDQSLTEAVLAYTQHVERDRRAALEAREQRARELREVNDALLVSSVRQHELTEQAQQAEHTQRESEARYRMLFDLGPVAVYSCDASGVIQDFNRRAADLWGRAPAQGVTDERFCGSFKMFRPDGTFMPHDQCPMADVLSGAIPSVDDGEVHIERPDGSRIVVIVSIRPLKNTRGEITGAINCFYDISERKAAEEALRNAKQEAEAASVAKDRFLAVLSHELRTPLTPALVAAGELALREDLPDEAREEAEIIRRNIELETRLIEDLLDLTRIANAKMTLHRSVADLHQIISGALEICRSDANLKQHRVAMELQAKRHHVFGDAARLQQIFWNLIRNAIKFTLDRGDITVRSFDADQDKVCVEVSDSGVGIEPDLLPRLFNAFQQGEGPMMRQSGGLGLGLALSRTLVEAHGGTLSATSEGHNRGSRFTVTLPAIAAPLDADDDGAQRAGAATKRTTAPLRILLVEDHADTARVMARVLQTEGHHVKTAHTALRALELAAGEPFDLLISDLGLPDATGNELVGRIHQLQPLTSIALSGFGTADDVSASRAAGFAAHLTKPVDLARLRAEIHRLRCAPAPRDSRDGAN